MFSLINHTTLRCFHDKPDVVDKAAYVLPYAAWVDMAVGVILCIIGALALPG